MKNLTMILIGLICPVITVFLSIDFQQNCSGYLKQAANANSVELAIERLDKAISYVERKNLTHGYTSILYRTEGDNIGFWYKNLVTCRKEPAESLNSPQYEKTNVLLKTRESLMDQTENGAVVSCPNGISRYPNNKLFAFLNTLSVILVIVGCVTAKPY